MGKKAEEGREEKARMGTWAGGTSLERKITPHSSSKRGV